MSPPKPDPFKQEDVDEVGAAIRLLIGAGNEFFSAGARAALVSV